MMEYTIKKLAEIAGVSKRTLRYYDEIGLLKPCRINSSGYRIYGEQEVDVLQQILFYREMDMKLENVQQIIQQDDFSINKALEDHLQQLLKKRKQIDQLILTIEKTMVSRKGDYMMSSKEKFEGFKKEQLEQNEKRYGAEIREKYGEIQVEASNKKFINLSEADFKKMQQIEEEMFVALEEVLSTNDLNSEAARSVYEKHKDWLNFTWNYYSAQAHVGLGKMYVEDERFAKYYEDRTRKGAAVILRDIIEKYAK